MTQPPAQHILSFAQTLSGGGVERALLRLAGLWLGAGRRVTLVLGDAAGPLADELPAGIDIVPVGSARYRDLMRAVPGAVAARRPDIIFCPGNHYGGVAAWTRLRLGRAGPPIVAKVSNALVRPDLGRAEAGYRAWLRLHPRFLAAVVAMTPGMAQEAAATMGMARSRIHVIANPPARRRSDAAPLALPAGRYMLGVGRLAPQKRWERAIAGFARAAPDDVRFVILGEGAERVALEAQVRALGLEGRVLMPGHAADPLPAIAAASVLVLTSEYEGVPGVLREALAAGTPVIATRSSVAVDEIVTRADQGSIIPVGDAEALDAALRHWLAPGRPRPQPVEVSGDPAADYLSLFDSLVSSSS